MNYSNGLKYSFLGSLIFSTFVGFLGIFATVFYEDITENSNLRKLTITIFILLIIVLAALFINLGYQMIKFIGRMKDVLRNIERISKKNYVAVESSNSILKEDLKSLANNLNNYYSLSKQTIRESQIEIIIYDYIDNQMCLNSILQRLEESSESRFKKTQKRIEEYYRTIEEHFSSPNSDLIYYRILMLPLSYPPLNKNYNFDSLTNEKKPLKEFISPATYKHLQRMMSLSESNKGQIHLKILPFAFVNYSFGIVDRSTLLLEMDTHNILGMSFMNNTLCIKDELNGRIVNPYNEYHGIFNNIVPDITDISELDLTIVDLKKKGFEEQKIAINKSIERYSKLAIED